MNHTLPAGLLDNHYEFFAEVDRTALHAYCLNHGHVIAFDAFPENVLYAIEAQIPDHKREAAAALGARGRLEVIKQFLICNYGGFDHQPDMVDGILQQPEFWACPYRGSCPQEGILCDPLKSDNGRNLSPREIDVIKLIAAGHLDKHIAHHLKISLRTVTTHTRNIRRKTGLLRKVDITGFAYKKQLL